MWLEETHSAREDAGTPKTSYGPPDDESDRVGRGPADGRADLKEADGQEEDALDAEEAVQLAEAQLERAVGEQVGRAIPPDVGDGVEVVCNLRDGSRDDQTVLGCLVLARPAVHG